MDQVTNHTKTETDSRIVETATVLLSGSKYPVFMINGHNSHFPSYIACWRYKETGLPVSHVIKEMMRAYAVREVELAEAKIALAELKVFG